MIRWLGLGVVTACAGAFVVFVTSVWEIERVQAEAAKLSLPEPPPRPPPPPPPPRSNEPRSVAPEQLERVSGQHEIQPPEAARAAMIADGKREVVGAFQLCLDTLGRVSAVTMLQSTGYDAYDKRLWATMWSWRYAPFMAGGRPIEVCTSITFVVKVR